jgi:hypothetical protein
MAIEFEDEFIDEAEFAALEAVCLCWTILLVCGNCAKEGGEHLLLRSSMITSALI